MGQLRRFQNLIVRNRFTGAKSLHRVDLTRQLFGKTATPPPSTIGEGSESALLLQDSTSQTPASFRMEIFQLPSPTFTFQAAPNEPGKIDFFPFADRRMLWADQLGRAFVFDAETLQMEIVPCLQRPKSTPLSLFVPNADADNNYDPGSSLFVMERFPRPEVSGSAQGDGDGQFEALVYCKPTVSSDTKHWQWRLLPPPPFVRQLKHCNSRVQPEISSYAAVSGGSHVCVSVEGVGTYCLDTASHEWSQVGEWTLPFRGKAEYVPELSLWFGISGDARHVAAADLSAMDSQPKLVGAWKEICMPEGWKECKDSRLVNLGSGKFCVARFFRATTAADDDSGEGLSGENFAVLTSVEAVSVLHSANSGGSNGKVEFRMIRHKSKRVSDTTIEVI